MLVVDLTWVYCYVFSFSFFKIIFKTLETVMWKKRLKEVVVMTEGFCERKFTASEDVKSFWFTYLA